MFFSSRTLFRRSHYSEPSRVSGLLMAVIVSWTYFCCPCQFWGGKIRYFVGCSIRYKSVLCLKTDLYLILILCFLSAFPEVISKLLPLELFLDPSLPFSWFPHWLKSSLNTFILYETQTMFLTFWKWYIGTGILRTSGAEGCVKTMG